MADNIWIIGASSGIGAELAKLLALRGHAVALSARDQEALAKALEQLHGNQHLLAPLDVTDRQAVAAARDSLLQSWPRIDRVIFMAGVYQPMFMGSMDLGQARKILEVNLLGAFHVAEAMLPHLLQNHGKQLALCASVAGYRGLPGGQPYGASKAGMINMAESLRAEHGDKLDIRLINPGFVQSRLTDKNDFAMPLIISAAKAAELIAEGLDGSGFEIHFPKSFTWPMKALRLLPNWAYQQIARRMRP